MMKMGKIYEIQNEGLMISSSLSIAFTTELEIEHKGNEHGCLELEAIIEGGQEEDILNRDWSKEKISVIRKNENNATLFQGTIAGIHCIKENQLLKVQILGIGETISLDREKKTKIFQNPQMTYKEVIKRVVGDCENTAVIWGEAGEHPIGEPLIQYEETDWKFLIRLCSHFHSRIFPDLSSGGSAFFFGLSKNREHSVNTAEIMESGYKESYYINGCREDGISRRTALYLKVQTKENWQMGDFLIYEGQRYFVHERIIRFAKGELSFIYELGAEGMYYEKKVHNVNIVGARLNGTVKKVSGETVYLQFDVDSASEAIYPWEWTPETNNLCYCTPEEGTKAVLVFSDKEEKSGYAVLAETENRGNGGYSNVQNREFVTKWKKKLGLYSNKIFLEGANGNSGIVLADLKGIDIKSNKEISVLAEKEVCLQGKRVFVEAPVETVCRTLRSNIELCKDINLYAPAGVQTIGTGSLKRGKAEREKNESGQRNVDSWQASYTALAAIPAVDFSKADEAETAVDIYTLGSVPKIAKGSAVIAMSEVMQGKKEEECSFPKVFQSMNNYTVKGGYALPEDIT